MPVSDLDSEELMSRAGTGDQLAVDELLNRHRDRLKRMITARMDSRLLRRIDPSDVVQDTLIEAMRKLPKFVVQRPIEFYPWLRQLAWNRLVDLYRSHIQADKRTVDREVSLGIMLSDDSVDSLAKNLVSARAGPGSELLRLEIHRRVRMTLESLPEKYGEALVMRHLEQLSIKEIASILGAPEGTIKARLFRGVQLLHQRLADWSSEVNS